MSEPSPEPISRRAARRAERGMRRETRRAVREGQKTLKAAYAQAARDVKRMDPAVRERIGRANLTKADLQHLANYHVSAEFRPGGQYADLSQRLGQVAAGRLQRVGASAAPTRNPFRQVANRISRWQNTRQGTKALKAAFTQAARDAKRMDPAVLASIGRSGINRHDLAAVAQARFDQVFRPEGRFGAVPGQQGQVPGQQGQQVGQQPGPGTAPNQASIQPQNAPRQAESVAQQVARMQQMIDAKQSEALQLMAEMNQLQQEMNQLIQTRMAQLQAEAAQLAALQQNPAAQQAQSPQQTQNGPQAQTPQQVQNPQQTQNGPQAQSAQQVQNGPEQPGQNAAEQPGERQPGLDNEWMAVATGNAEPRREQIPQHAQPAQQPTAEHQTAPSQHAQPQTGPQRAEQLEIPGLQAADHQNGEHQTGPRQTAEQLEIPGLQVPQQGGSKGEAERKGEAARAMDAALKGTRPPQPGTADQARRTAESSGEQPGKKHQRTGQSKDNGPHSRGGS